MLKKLLFLLTTALLVSTTTLAQSTKKVTGVVVDGIDGSPLPGATVTVTGNTGIGVSTDFDG